MSVSEMMNYRYNNPDVEVEVDIKITERFVEREREPKEVENFELWGSVSKESAKVGQMINAYKQQSFGNTISVKR